MTSILVRSHQASYHEWSFNTSLEAHLGTYTTGCASKLRNDCEPAGCWFESSRGSLPQSQTSGWGFLLAAGRRRKSRRQRQFGQHVAPLPFSPACPVQLNPPPVRTLSRPALSDSRPSPRKRVNRHDRGGPTHALRPRCSNPSIKLGRSEAAA